MWRDHKIENFVRFFKTYYDFGDPNYYKKVAYQDLRERMYSEAIRDNGIYATFRFRGPFEKESCYVTILDYIKIDYPSDMRLYPDMFKESFGIKQITFSKTDDKGIQDYKYILGSCLMYNQTGEVDDKLKRVLEEIKEECAKKHNAIYSTVEIDSIEIFEETKTIFIRYIYFHIRDKFIDKLNSDDVIFGAAPLPYGKWFSSDSDSTDESEKESNIPAPAKEVYKSLKNKEYINYVDCTPPAPTKNAISYCSSDAMVSELLLKENKNMRMIVHLLIVPEGMSEEFVNNTKKNLQYDDDTTLYISSNDIAFEPNDEYKTKYDLLEYWVKSGQIHCVEFMVGYENDPEVKAFEAFIKGFIRGIKTNSSSVDTVNLWYQKDTIKRTIDSLRDDYVESSKARERLDNITDKIMNKVKCFKEYGLEDDDFDSIRNGNCFKDICNDTVDKITEIAFDSDKKGNKKK